VIKSEGGGDTLVLLRKEPDHFESIDSMACGFVQMKGKYQLDSLKPIPLEDLPEWPDLKDKLIHTRPFWWGGKGKEDFPWRTLGVRSYLGITEPTFRAFKMKRPEGQIRERHYFGLWDQEQKSLVIAKDDLLLTYGNPTAEERLLNALERWINLGMPSAASFALKIYPVDFTLTANENEWIVKRQESQFLWSLKS
jgi:hypothetical protein